MTTVGTPPAENTDAGLPGRLSVLRSIESRVLWLSTAIIDHANRIRPNESGMKVAVSVLSDAAATPFAH